MNLHIVIQITISASISRIYFAAQKPCKGHLLSKHRTRDGAEKKRILHSLASKRIYYPPLGEVEGGQEESTVGTRGKILKVIPLLNQVTMFPCIMA